MPQKKIYGDPIFFEDEEEEFTLEYCGIFKSRFQFVDAISQQQVISEEPTFWVSWPLEGVEIKQGTKLQWKDRLFRIKELKRDVDNNAMNLVVHEVGPVNEG